MASWKGNMACLSIFYLTINIYNDIGLGMRIRVRMRRFRSRLAPDRLARSDIRELESPG